MLPTGTRALFASGGEAEERERYHAMQRRRGADGDPSALGLQSSPTTEKRSGPASRFAEPAEAIWTFSLERKTTTNKTRIS